MVVVWVAVDKDGTELIYNSEPIRNDKYYEDLGHTKLYEGWKPVDEYSEKEIVLPKGTIEKLIGYKLTWNDEPVRLKDG